MFFFLSLSKLKIFNVLGKRLSDLPLFHIQNSQFLVTAQLGPSPQNPVRFHHRITVPTFTCLMPYGLIRHEKLSVYIIVFFICFFHFCLWRRIVIIDIVTQPALEISLPEGQDYKYIARRNCCTMNKYQGEIVVLWIWLASIKTDSYWYWCVWSKKNYWYWGYRTCFLWYGQWCPSQIRSEIIEWIDCLDWRDISWPNHLLVYRAGLCRKAITCYFECTCYLTLHKQ